MIVAPAFPQDTRVSLPRMARLCLHARLLTLAFRTPKKVRAPYHRARIAASLVIRQKSRFGLSHPRGCCRITSIPFRNVKRSFCDTLATSPIGKLNMKIVLLAHPNVRDYYTASLLERDTLVRPATVNGAPFSETKVKAALVPAAPAIHVPEQLESYTASRSATN